MTTKGKFPNRLAEFMKAAGIGVSDLAERSGVSKQNISRHREGSRRLTEGWAKKYARHLGVASFTELMFPKPKAVKPARTPAPKSVSVPLVSSVPAGRVWANEGVTLQNVRKTLIANGLPSGDWIALEVDGDSADRIAPDGAIIFVNRADKRLVKDSFYVFSTEAGETTFKMYRPGPDRMVPYSNNPVHEPVPLTDGFFVVGRARRVMLDI